MYLSDHLGGVSMEIQHVTYILYNYTKLTFDYMLYLHYNFNYT